MALAVGLNLVFVVIEGGFGFLSNSVALIADAGHNLGDVLGLVCAWTAIRLARRPPGGQFTYGLGRSSVLAALANAVLLLVACGVLFLLLRIVMNHFLDLNRFVWRRPLVDIALMVILYSAAILSFRPI